MGLRFLRRHVVRFIQIVIMNINKKLIEVGWQAALSCHAHHGMSGWSSHRKEYIKAAVDEVKKSQEYKNLESGPRKETYTIDLAETMECSWPVSRDIHDKAASELRRLAAVESERDALKAENERLLAANLDCITHYEDARAELERIKAMEPVAWRTFDGEGDYDYRTYDMNESYAEDYAKRNPNHAHWVEPLYALGSKT